MPPSLRSL
uniref:Uncharacterized protein n=1 Tax=Arundo donax TaxID=35708 RepID=A0A0A9HE99_ARUDO